MTTDTITIDALRLAADRSRSPTDRRAMRAGAAALAELLDAHQELQTRHETLLSASLELLPGAPG